MAQCEYGRFGVPLPVRATGQALYVVLALVGFLAVPCVVAQNAVSDAMAAALNARDKPSLGSGVAVAVRGSRNLSEGITCTIGTGPFSGRINEIAIAPTNSHVMFATGATGGVWKSTDDGVTWAARSQGWRIQAATAVTVDPHDAESSTSGPGLQAGGPCRAILGGDNALY